MHCPDCQTELPAGAAFCAQCGRKLGAAPTTPAEKLRAGPSAASEPEQTLWQGGYSAKAMYGSWALALLVTAVAVVASLFLPNPVTWLVAAVIVVVLWLVLLAYYLTMRLSVEYTLTNQRFVHKVGLLRRVSNRVEVIDIDDVQYEQGLFERMFGVGTIKLLSSDVSDPKLTLRGIDDVARVANLIDNARRDERRKRGLYVETV
jgi:membrane protein YdbS with pleckstrin-like domain